MIVILIKTVTAIHIIITIAIINNNKISNEKR